MSKKHLEIVNNVARIWNRGNAEDIDQYLTHNFRNHDPAYPPLTDAEGYKAFIRELKSGLPDFEVVTDEMFACDNRVVARWTASGTQKGEIFGRPPTDKYASWSGITIYRFEGDKIAEAWWAYDQLRILEQLGVAPPRTERPQGMVHPERETKR